MATSSRSNRLRLREVREVFHLIAEVRELGDDPPRWQRHAAERLKRLIPSAAVVSAELYRMPDRSCAFNNLFDIDYANGAPPAMDLRYADPARAPDWPFVGPMIRAVERSGAMVRSRDIPDRDWYACPMFADYIRLLGYDDFLHSQQYLPQAGGAHLLCFSRPANDTPFSPRERRLLRLFHEELAHLFAAQTPGRAVAAEGLERVEVTLSPRLRQTLDCLRMGDGEKQAALRLGVSRHTIHKYVKALHKQFNVSSRGELLATAGTIPPRLTPRLAGPPLPPGSPRPKPLRLQVTHLCLVAATTFLAALQTLADGLMPPA